MDVPSRAVVGEVFIASITSTISFSLKNLDYDHNLLELQSADYYSHHIIPHKTKYISESKFKVKARNILGSVDTKITIAVKFSSNIPFMYSTQTRSKTLPIYGLPFIENNVKDICKGTNITYKLMNASPSHLINLVDNPQNFSSNIQWNAGNNLTLMSGQGTPDATFRANENGLGDFKVQIGLSNGNTYNLEGFRFRIGPPIEIKEISGFDYNGMNFSPNTYYEFFVSKSGGASNLKWTLVPSQAGEIVAYTDNEEKLTIKTANLARKTAFQLSVITDNMCGSSSFQMKGFVSNDPNLRSQNEATAIESLPLSGGLKEIFVRIYSISGIIVYSTRLDNQKLDLNTLNLPSGIYIKETTDNNGKVQREKISLIKK